MHLKLLSCALCVCWNIYFSTKNENGWNVPCYLFITDHGRERRRAERPNGIYFRQSLSPKKDRIKMDSQEFFPGGARGLRILGQHKVSLRRYATSSQPTALLSRISVRPTVLLLQSTETLSSTVLHNRIHRWSYALTKRKHYSLSVRKWAFWPGKSAYLGDWREWCARSCWSRSHHDTIVYIRYANTKSA